MVVDSGGGADSAGGARAASTPAPPPQRPAVAVMGAALVIAGGLLVGLILNLVVLSPLKHARDQQVAYADLRSELANAVAPLATFDRAGTPLALGVPVAVLQIPSIGVDEVVLNGTTSTVLMSGPGLRRDTVMPGQVGHSVIMGRVAGFAGPFSAIDSLAPGEQIIVVTGQGEQAYEVTAIRSGDELPVPLKAGEGRLTLVTAAGAPFVPSGTTQVDATLVSEPRPAAGPAVPSFLVLAEERPLSGDSSAVIGLLLWSGLLLVASVTLVWLRTRWGPWQTWVVAVPVIAALGIAVTNHILMLLPNLM